LNLRPPAYWRLRPLTYRLEGYRCLDCGHFHTSKRIVCRRCGSRKLDVDRLPTSGRLVDFTVIYQAQQGFEHTTPYIVGLVEMVDGTKIVAQMTDCEPSELWPGMEVEAVVRKLTADGDAKLIAYGVKFRPVI